MAHLNRYAHLIRAVRDAVLTPRATLDHAIRRAAVEYRDLPEPFRQYVAKVREHAYTVVDEDLDRLKAAGYTEDQLFELTVAAALGAGLRRLEIGLRALDGGA